MTEHEVQKVWMEKDMMGVEDLLGLLRAVIGVFLWGVTFGR